MLLWSYWLVKLQKNNIKNTIPHYKCNIYNSQLPEVSLCNRSVKKLYTALRSVNKANMTISEWLNTRNFRLKKYFFSLSICSSNVFQIQSYLSVSLTHYIADPGSRAVYSIGLKPADCLDFLFESLWQHEYSSRVFAVCCVGSSLGKKLTTHSEEPYQVCVIWKPIWWIGLDLSLAVAPPKNLYSLYEVLYCITPLYT